MLGDHNGDLVHAESKRILEGINLLSEVMAFRMGLEYGIEHNFIPVCLEYILWQYRNL